MTSDRSETRDPHGQAGLRCLWRSPSCRSSACCRPRFTGGLHPLGIEWPSTPAGKLRRRLQRRSDAGPDLSSVLIVLGVVPAAVVISTMAGFDRTSAHHRWPTAVPGVPHRPDAAVRGDHHPAVLPGTGVRDPHTKWAIILPLIGLYMHFAVFWMRAHFINMPRNSRRPLGSMAPAPGTSSADPSAPGKARRVGPRDPALRLDVEPVPAGAGPGRGPAPAGPWPAPLAPTRATTDQHPATVRRVAAYPDPHAHRLPALPATVHLSPLARLTEGLITGGQPCWACVRARHKNDGSRHAHEGARCGRRIVSRWLIDGSLALRGVECGSRHS